MKRMKGYKCRCGCGKYAKPGNKFIYGHHARLRKGWNHTEETKTRLSNQAKGRNGPNKGRKFSEEWRKNISESRKGMVLSEEHKNKIKRSVIETYKDPAIRLKCGRKGLKITKEHRLHIKNYMIAAWKNPEFYKRLIGENANNWKGGLSFEPYGIDFNNILKRKIKERDNNRCQNPNCQIETSLTVHHIDYDKLNNKKLNLITLCNACNSKANFNRSYWEKFYRKIIRRVHYNETYGYEKNEKTT